MDEHNVIPQLLESDIVGVELFYSEASAEPRR